MTIKELAMDSFWLMCTFACCSIIVSIILAPFTSKQRAKAQAYDELIEFIRQNYNNLFNEKTNKKS